MGDESLRSLIAPRQRQGVGPALKFFCVAEADCSQKRKRGGRFTCARRIAPSQSERSAAERVGHTALAGQTDSFLSFPYSHGGLCFKNSRVTKKLASPYTINIFEIP